MEQPTHDLRTHIGTSTAADAGRRTVALVVVGVLHVGLIFAIIAGLKAGLIQKLPEELVAEVVKPKDEVKPPPPPPPDLVKPPPPFVPPPEINIATDSPATNAIQAVQPTVQVPPPVAQPTITPSKAVGRTHDCQSYYPALSARLNESGNVRVRYDVGVDGAISNVAVTTSSGSERLDNAAVQCVSSRWRNTPAMQGDTPVASPNHEAIIQFQLH